MRAPFQILVIPFRHTTNSIEYALLKRSDEKYWQFVAGGGEENESPLTAAIRETTEETGVIGNGNLLQLDSVSSIPKCNFVDAVNWAEDIYVIPEYSFAIDIENAKIILSSEHDELCWAPYQQAHKLLKWDSNRNALWELNERLKGYLIHKIESISTDFKIY